MPAAPLIHNIEELQADPLLRHEVVGASLLLYGDPDAYAAYKVFSQRDLMDSRDLLDLEKRLHDKRMAYIRSRLAEDRGPEGIKSTPRESNP
jgi:hypothetical protein